jgi:hypothetical protein
MVLIQTRNFVSKAKNDHLKVEGRDGRPGHEGGIRMVSMLELMGSHGLDIQLRHEPD